MAAPGTIAHVLEVAKQLAAAADVHAAAVSEQAAAVTVGLVPDPAGDRPPPA